MHKAFIIFLISIFWSCVYHDSNETFNCNSSDLNLKIDSISSATSCNITDGAIYTLVKGGKAPYVYTLNNTIQQSQNSFTGLASGTYSLTVKDQNGCTVSLSNINVVSKDFLFSTIITEDNGCTQSNGSITVNVTENNETNFFYKLGDGTFSTNNVFVGLPHGDYDFTVKNEESCVIELKIKVPRGNSGTSWSNDILPIIKTSCAISGCHDGISRTLDYRKYANAKKKAADIKAKTQDGSMPFDGPSLTKNQIDLIACWVDDGAIEN